MTLLVRRIVSEGQTTVKKVVVSEGQTTVKKVVVGIPVRRVTPGAFTIDAIRGVNTTGKVDGSILVYDETSGDFEASEYSILNQSIDGGTY
jgi:hypothetical protein